jgi:hypothetical protein
VTYGVLIPAVLLIGYFIGAPSGVGGYMLIAILLSIMMFPLMMAHHHLILIASWNAAFTFGFLPGLPKVWYLVAFFSLGMTMLARIVHRQPLVTYRPLSFAMVFLAAVAILTGFLRGGLGMKALGSDMYGGKAFAYIIIAVIGYFALSSVRIPKRRALLYVALFFFTTLTLILSNVVYLMGQKFWFLYLFVPVDYAIGQAQADFLSTEVRRYGGVGFALMGVYFYMLIRYGIRGIFDITRPLRLAVLLLVIAGSLLGGFRSTVILYLLIFVFQFWYEGLLRTKYLWLSLASLVFALSLLYPFARELPVSFQRSLSFMPGLKVDLAARADAEASVEWRLKIWSVLWPQVGDYLFLGKGFVYDASDVYLAEESTRRGFMQSEDFAIITGDYHSGPLSIAIPLGIWGVLAFTLINIFGMRMLYLQFKNGDPDLYLFNQGMLALFSARIVYFWLFFGAVASDLATFAGILGLSLALNGAPRTQPWVAEEEQPLEVSESETEQPRLPKPSSIPASQWALDKGALEEPLKDV